MLKSGIYKIVNIINNQIYIGSSSNLYQRKHQHFSKLKHNKHSNQHLQNSYNKHKKDNFKFIVLERCNIENLLIKEQLYLDTNDCHYNKRIIAESNRGWKMSQETKNKISKSNTGRTNSEEYKKRHSKLLKSIKRSKEACKNISESKKGFVFTKEHKSKLKESYSKREIKGNPTKLDVEKVKEIKLLLLQNKSLSYIGNIYDVSSAMISKIKNNLAWANVKI